jgi:hypothetical protein
MRMRQSILNEAANWRTLRTARAEAKLKAERPCGNAVNLCTSRKRILQLRAALQHKVTPRSHAALSRDPCSVSLEQGNGIWDVQDALLLFAV